MKYKVCLFAKEDSLAFEIGQKKRSEH